MEFLRGLCDFCVSRVVFLPRFFCVAFLRGFFCVAFCVAFLRGFFAWLVLRGSVGYWSGF